MLFLESCRGKNACVKSKNDDDTIFSSGPLCGASEALGSKFHWTNLVDAYGKYLYDALCSCNNTATQISIPLKPQSPLELMSPSSLAEGVGWLNAVVSAVVRITP